MIAIAGLAATYFVGCLAMSSAQINSITHEAFGKMPDGASVEIYTLRNSHGMEVRIMTYGGTVVSLKVPDKDGKLADVVLGYDNLNSYLRNGSYFGALIGRYGNRIAKGKFTLDGHEYTLPVNNAPNTLHGGPQGFDKVVWTARPTTTADGAVLELTYLSKDGEQGFPGNLLVKATYTVTEKNELSLQFTATTDKDTVVNLTHHSYFNLRGTNNVLDHLLYINADKFTPVDRSLIPTGDLKPVEGTPFDFRTPIAIGTHIKDDNEQLKFGNGYDHNWVINKKEGLALAARVTDPVSGRVMEVLTTSPGLQFYTGNYLSGTGKYGWAYQPHDSYCFEPQGFPDSPNHPDFPTTELKSGQTYTNTIIYKFSVR